MNKDYTDGIISTCGDRVTSLSHSYQHIFNATDLFDLFQGQKNKVMKKKHPNMRKKTAKDKGNNQIIHHLAKMIKVRV